MATISEESLGQKIEGAYERVGKVIETVSLLRNEGICIGYNSTRNYLFKKGLLKQHGDHLNNLPALTDSQVQMITHLYETKNLTEIMKITGLSESRIRNVVSIYSDNKMAGMVKSGPGDIDAFKMFREMIRLAEDKLGK